MALNVYDFDTPVKTRVYWDASFIINSLESTSKYFKECSSLYLQLSEDEAPSITASLSLDEIWYVQIRHFLIDIYSKQWRRELAKDPTIIKPIIPTLKGVTNNLYALPYLDIIEVNQQNTKDALKYIDKYSLLPRDALHLAVMLSHGAKNIVTTDLDFLRVKDQSINIYTCNPEAF